MFTHFPKDPNCEICQANKTQRAPCKNKTHGKPDDLPEPKKFADAMTSDHKVLNADDADRVGDQLAFIVQDRHTQWLQGFPCKSKNAQETK